MAYVELNNNEQHGNITVHKNIIAAIAGAVLVENESVKVRKGLLIHDVVSNIANSDIARGIELNLENGIEIDVFVMLSTECDQLEEANKIVKDIRHNIEVMLGLTIDSINVHVIGRA